MVLQKCKIGKGTEHKNSWCSFHAQESIREECSRVGVGWRGELYLEAGMGLKKKEKHAFFCFTSLSPHILLLLPDAPFQFFLLNLLPSDLLLIQTLWVRAAPGFCCYPEFSLLPSVKGWVQGKNIRCGLGWVWGHLNWNSITYNSTFGTTHPHTITLFQASLYDSPMYKNILVCQVKARISRTVLMYLFWFSP